jgi:hypothetical protein
LSQGGRSRHIILELFNNNSRIIWDNTSGPKAVADRLFFEGFFDELYPKRGGIQPW